MPCHSPAEDAVRRSRRAVAIAALAMAAWTPGSSLAIDIVAAHAPADVPDGVLQIGGRKLQLPPGDWRLVQRDEFEVHASRHMRSVDAYGAWVVLLEGRRFRGIVHLSLPVADAPQVGRGRGNPCESDNDILRVDLSRGKPGSECLAVFGHHDLARSLQRRASRAVDWMLDHGVTGLDTGVQISYVRKLDGSFGHVDVFLPAEDFESDTEASQWATTLREALEPFLDETADSARLPALPAPPSVAPAAPAASVPPT
jgi:hypothetical protein